MFKNNDKYYYHDKINSKHKSKNNKFFVFIILLLEILFLSFIYLNHQTSIDNFFCDVYRYVFSNSSDETISDQESPTFDNIDYQQHYSEEYYTAYHEAGHTLISLYLQSNNKYRTTCQFVSANIIPRNKFLGVTNILYFSKQPMLEVLVSVGGFAAELILKDDNKIPFYKVGEGCGSDLTSIKKKLLEHQFSESQIKRFINIAIQKVKFIFKHNKKYLEYIAELLLSRKKITYKDLQNIIPYLKNKIKN